MDWLLLSPLCMSHNRPRCVPCRWLKCYRSEALETENPVQQSDKTGAIKPPIHLLTFCLSQALLVCVWYIHLYNALCLDYKDRVVWERSGRQRDAARSRLWWQASQVLLLAFQCGRSEQLVTVLSSDVVRWHVLWSSLFEAYRSLNAMH